MENKVLHTYTPITDLLHLYLGLLSSLLHLQRCCDVAWDHCHLFFLIPRPLVLGSLKTPSQSHHNQQLPLLCVWRDGGGNMWLHWVCFNWNYSQCKIHEQTAWRFGNGVWYSTGRNLCCLAWRVLGCKLYHKTHAAHDAGDAFLKSLLLVNNKCPQALVKNHFSVEF